MQHYISATSELPDPPEICSHTSAGPAVLKVIPCNSCYFQVQVIPTWTPIVYFDLSESEPLVGKPLEEDSDPLVGKTLQEKDPDLMPELYPPEGRCAQDSHSLSAAWSSVLPGPPGHGCFEFIFSLQRSVFVSRTVPHLRRCFPCGFGGRIPWQVMWMYLHILKIVEVL